MGEGVSLLVTAFKAGALPGLMKDGLVIAAKSMVNTAAAGFKGIVGALMAALGQIPAFFAAGMKVVTDHDFWTHSGNTMAGGIRMASVKVTQMLPDWMVPGEKMSEGQERKLMESLKAWTKGNAMGAMDQVMSEALPMIEETRKAMEEALASAAVSGDLFDVSENRSRFQETLDGLRQVIEARKKEQAVIEETEKAKAGLVKPDAMGEGPLAAMMGRVKPAVSSLGRIGGASLRSGRVERMDRERNALLKQIKENTGRGTVAVYS